ncbi:MAG: porin [Candidatus Thiodiazotropha sp. (ex Ctena orbiculata)]|uniref:Porin n=1 Tax=Candidatus Thiodiazotropha taylori TaxID=2792791 RepID=A0A944MFE9_9GAMM|nr:porin [Candidatus Thiodiazotropha taylori]MBT2990402.1 porin [Candidatus Thiodiazotropha taylori]MBT2998055.1 porin [Candidatus Thiodiazotropha taylori]MBT3002266.1 porin [Candidatus Thiodiazotropha taylori]MBV2109247.1 porin [Candidatus Thiodiazotropha taylori]
MKYRFIAILGGLLCCCTPALFAYDVTDSFDVNAFGTVGVSTNDSDEIQFKVYPEQESSVDEGEFDFGLNTVLGLQARYQFSDALSFTTQGVARYKGRASWSTDIDWAYLNYDTPWSLSLRAGKFRFPIFHSSELAFVGYSRLYTRPALSFYGIGGYEHLHGLQASYNTSIERFDLAFQGSYGQSDNETPVRADGSFDKIESDDIKILSTRFGNDQFWINLAYTRLNSEVTTVPPIRPAIRLGVTDISMWSAEWQFRVAGLVVDGGYGKGEVERFQPDEELRYISLSYPVESFTPYLLYSSKQFSDLPRLMPANPGAPPLPPPPPPPDASDLSDETYSIGFRYDFHHNLALKCQLDHIKAGARSRVSNNPTGERGTHNALSLVLDWMF